MRNEHVPKDINCFFHVFQIIDISSVEVIAEKVKDCKIQIVDNCGHAVTFERPLKSGKLILQFIHSLSSNGGNSIDMPWKKTK